MYKTVQKSYILNLDDHSFYGQHSTCADLAEQLFL